MRIDEGHHHFGRRSSSAWAKNAEAFRKISLARRSSRTYGVEPICALVPIAPSTYYEQKARLVDPARARLSLRSGLQRRCEISISTTSYAREAEMEIDGGRPRSGIVSPFLAWMRHQSTTIQKTRNLVRDVFTEARCQCTDHGPCTILALREIGVDVTGPVCQFSSRNAGEPALGPLGRQATGPSARAVWHVGKRGLP